VQVGSRHRDRHYKEHHALIFDKFYQTGEVMALPR
jgi:hypothetical protein